MVAFDILGEMAFGEGFGCVDKGTQQPPSRGLELPLYPLPVALILSDATEHHHSWMDLILKHLFEVTLVDNLRRVQALTILGRWLLPSLTSAVREEHSMYSRAKVQKRLHAKTPRQDFFTHIVNKVRAGEVSSEEMTAHASTLM